MIIIDESKRGADLIKFEQTHVGDRPFSCLHCDYTCAQSGVLKRHERIHTGDKPFSCTKCNTKFTASSSMRKHERKCHHTESKNKSYTSSFLQEIKTEPTAAQNEMIMNIRNSNC